MFGQGDLRQRSAQVLKRRLGAASLRGRGLAIAVDSASAAVVNAGVLVLSARALSPNELTALALAVLLGTSAVTLQRGGLLAPALAVQRRVGRRVIPSQWALVFPPLLGGSTGILTFLTGTGVGYTACLVAGLTFLMCAVDVLRARILGTDLFLLLLRHDAVLLVFGLLVVCWPGASNAQERLVRLVGLWGLVLVVAGWSTLRLRTRAVTVAPVSLREASGLAKWGLLDNALAVSANLMPLLVSTAVMAPQVAGVYRVAQSTLGPLNIFATAIGTSFALSAWQLQSHEALLKLRSRVRRTSVLLVCAVAIYLMVADAFIVLISGISGPDSIRVLVVVGVYGVVYAATVPLQAGALALGRQSCGAVLRVFIFAFSISCSFVPGLLVYLPWRDPVASVSLFSAGLGFVVWSVVFARASTFRLQNG